MDGTQLLLFVVLFFTDLVKINGGYRVSEDDHILRSEIIDLIEIQFDSFVPTGLNDQVRLLAPEEGCGLQSQGKTFSIQNQGML